MIPILHIPTSTQNKPYHWLSIPVSSNSNPHNPKPCERLSNGAILRLPVHALRLKISPILATFIVNIFKIKGMNMTRDISQQSSSSSSRSSSPHSASFWSKDAESICALISFLHCWDISLAIFTPFILNMFTINVVRIGLIFNLKACTDNRSMAPLDRRTHAWLWIIGITVWWYWYG